MIMDASGNTQQSRESKRANKYQLADCPTHDDDATGAWTKLHAAGKCPTKQLQNLRVEDETRCARGELGLALCVR